MLSVLVKFVFKLITKVFSIIMTPLITAVTSLFPNLNTPILAIIRFVTWAVTYISSATHLLLIPSACLVLLFDYFAIRYSIYIARLALNFAVNVYNKFKP